MQSYFDKRLNRKILYNKLFINDIPVKSKKMSGESIGSADANINVLISNEHARIRFLYAINETFTYSTLVARSVFNNTVDLSKYEIKKEIKKEINFTSSASLVEQTRKIYKSYDVVTIVEHDYASDLYKFLDKWYAFIKQPLYKHTIREVTDALNSVGYKTTIITNITSSDVNPLFKYQIDCVKIDSIKVP